MRQAWLPSRLHYTCRSYRSNADSKSALQSIDATGNALTLLALGVCPRKSGSQQTPRWSKQDSNPRSPVGETDI
jgi:hypothetical protein